MKKIDLTIAGAFVYYEELLPFILHKKYHKKYNITVYDSIDFCEWNGGRKNYKNNYSENKIKSFNKFGISVGLSFSNTKINFKSKEGFNYLSTLNKYAEKYNVVNYVYVCNHKLNEIIHNKYHMLKTKQSITCHPDYLMDFPSGNEKELFVNYYQNSLNLFDIIVPKREHLVQDWFVENISLNNFYKIQVLLNYSCQYNCPLHQTHYKLMKRKEFDNDDSNIHKCILNPNTYKKTQRDFSKEFMKNLIDIGYNNFKIAGRDTDFNEVKKDVECYFN